MNLKNFLENIKRETFITVFMSMVFLIAPGLTIIYLFKNPLFISFDSIKLVLLSLCMSSPFVLVNYIVFSEEIDRLGEFKDSDYRGMVLAIAVAGISLYLCAFCSYYFRSPELESVFLYATLIDAFFMLMGYSIIRGARRTKE